MGGEKGGGFFNLFDWNRKPRKKLFSNGPFSPEGIKQSKRSDENLSKRRPRLIDEEEIAVLSSTRGSSNVSCASSVVDEEGNGSRAPGVVARLMGLDSLPTSGVSEPYAAPLGDLISFRDNLSQKRGPAPYTDDRFSRELGKHDPYCRKAMEMRSQKMPSSPIERFQTEQLPPRTARCVPIDYNKLLSPIKNPGFISGRNAADIMEAAAKILEPEARMSAKIKVPSFVSSSTPLKFRESSMAASQRTLRLPDSSRRLVESTAARSLGGQSLNQSWDGTEEITILRSSPETNQPGAKSKGTTVSLAVQAKVNVQRRDGSSVSIRNSSSHKDRLDGKSSQPSNRKNKPHMRASASSSSSVLRQNNLKQNCQSSKDKLSLKPMTLEHQGRKVPSGEAPSRKNKTVSQLSGNHKVCYEKQDLGTTDFDKAGLPSGNKNFPRKKRMIDRGLCHNKRGYIERKSADTEEKSIQPKLIGDEHSGESNNTDIVSFTFTSPMAKPMNGSRSLTQVLEKWEQNKGCSRDSNSRNSAVDAKRKCLSSLGLSKLSGDALSIILEQKLRELTSNAELPYHSFKKAGSARTSEPFAEESVSATDTVSSIMAENDFISPCSGRDKLDVVSDSNLCIRKQEVEAIKCRSSNDAKTDSNYRHFSPLSTLEAAFTNDSYNSSESWGNTEGNEAYSSVQAHKTFARNCLKETQLAETEMELSDSASSVRTRVGDEGDESKVGSICHSQEWRQEIGYIRQLLSNAEPMLKSLGLCKTLDPILFDKLENKLSRSICGPGDKDSRIKRKLLFACINECLDLNHTRYFRAGYRAWIKGILVVQRDLAGQIHQEISMWKNMGNLMVDELVDRDMSFNLGSWVDFEIEAFETGVEIQKGILNELVDELVADFLTKASASFVIPL